MDKELNILKDEVNEIKARLGEEFELSESAKGELGKAREEMDTEYITHEDIMKKYG